MIKYQLSTEVIKVSTTGTLPVVVVVEGTTIKGTCTETRLELKNFRKLGLLVDVKEKEIE